MMQINVRHSGAACLFTNGLPHPFQMEAALVGKSLLGKLKSKALALLPPSFTALAAY